MTDTPCVCLSGVRGVGGVQLQSRLGRDLVPEGDPEGRLRLPGGAQTPPSADLQPVRGHFQKVSRCEAASLSVINLKTSDLISPVCLFQAGRSSKQRHFQREAPADAL